MKLNDKTSASALEPGGPPEETKVIHMATGGKKPEKKKGKGGTIDTSKDDYEPLSNFQEPKTGATDPSIHEPRTDVPAHVRGMSSHSAMLSNPDAEEWGGDTDHPGTQIMTPDDDGEDEDRSGNNPETKIFTRPEVASMSIEFSRLKLQDNLFASGEYVEVYGDDQYRNPTMKSVSWPVHSDLRNAFRAFIVHFALITEMIDAKKVKGRIEEFSSPQLDAFTVTSVKLTNNRDGVTISGTRKLKSKKTMPFNCPATLFHEEGYAFGTELQIAWDNLVLEALAYFKGEKFGEGKQGDLFGETNTYTEPGL